MFHRLTLPGILHHPSTYLDAPILHGRTVASPRFYEGM